MFFVYGIGLGLPLRLAGDISAYFGGGLPQAGFFVSMLDIGMAVGFLSGGILSGMINRKTVIIISNLIYAAGLAGLGLKISLASSFVFIFLLGTGVGLFQSSCSSFVLDLYPEKRISLANWTQVFMVLGISSVSLISGAVMMSEQDWNVAFLIVLPLVLILLVLFIWFFRNISPAVEKIGFFMSLQALKNKSFIILCIIMFLYASSEIGISTQMISFLEKEKTVGPLLTGLIYTLFWLAMIPGRILTVRLLRRMRAERIVAICLILAVPAILTAVFSINPIMIMVGFVLTGFFLSPAFPTLLGLCANAAGGNTGMATSICFESLASGQAVYASAMGLLTARFDYSAAFLSVVSIIIIQVIIILIVPKNHVKPSV
jgi:MFS transporter, FHS family, glucose/mannose:H+ symporter